MAGAVAFDVAAGVAGPDDFSVAAGVVDVQGGGASGAVEEAGEEVFVRGGFAAWVGKDRGGVVGFVGDEFLDGIEGFVIHEGFAVVFYHQVGVFEDADVEFVGKEGFEGGDGGEEVGFGEDLVAGGAR